MSFFVCNDATRHTFGISLPVVGALRGPVTLKVCSGCGQVRLSDAALGAWRNSPGAEQVRVEVRKPTVWTIHRSGSGTHVHLGVVLLGDCDVDRGQYYREAWTVHDTDECDRGKK